MKLLYDMSVQLACMGIPYVWGSKNPVGGFDCSGLTQWLMQSVGLGPADTLNAQGQYTYWKIAGKRCSTKLGALIFFGKSETQVNHVGFCIDSKRMLEAAHGSNEINNRAVAAAKNAVVRISPVTRRSDVIDIFTPDYLGVFDEQ